MPGPFDPESYTGGPVTVGVPEAEFITYEIGFSIDHLGVAQPLTDEQRRYFDAVCRRAMTPIENLSRK